MSILSIKDLNLYIREKQILQLGQRPPRAPAARKAAPPTTPSGGFSFFQFIFKLHFGGDAGKHFARMELWMVSNDRFHRADSDSPNERSVAQI